jgi:hypothetical protein
VTNARWTQGELADSPTSRLFADAETGAWKGPEIANPASLDPVFLHCGIGPSCPGKPAKLRGLRHRSNLLVAVSTSEKID